MWSVTRREEGLCHSTVVTMEYDGLVAGAMAPSCVATRRVTQVEVPGEVKPGRGTGRQHPLEHRPRIEQEFIWQPF